MLTSSPESRTSGVWPFKCSVTVLFWHVNTFTHQEETFPVTFQFVRKLFSLAWGLEVTACKANKNLKNAVPLSSHTSFGVSSTVLIQSAQCFTGFSPARSIDPLTLALLATCTVLCSFCFLFVFCLFLERFNIWNCHCLCDKDVIVLWKPGQLSLFLFQTVPAARWKLRGSWEVKPWRAELVEADLIGFHWLN